MFEELQNWEGFDWDLGNEFKSELKHGISRHEIETVFVNKPLYFFEDARHQSVELRYLALGVAHNDKLLSVSFTIRDNRIRVISARPMSRKERSVYANYET